MVRSAKFERVLRFPEETTPIFYFPLDGAGARHPGMTGTVSLRSHYHVVRENRRRVPDINVKR